MKTEIIIFKCNNKELEDECVKRVLDCTDTDYHLTVYDNYPTNEGFPVLVNRCVSRSDADYIVLLNSDAFVEPMWLPKLIAELKDGVGIVGPVTNNAVEQQQPKSEGVQEAKMLSGFCMLFKKSVWEEVGGFDEHYRFYFDDDDFCESVKAIGYKLIIVKSVFVEHRMRQTMNKMWDKDAIDKVFQQSKEYFEQKWATKWKNHL